MTDQPDNLVLHLLREIRAKQDEHSANFSDANTRLAAVEKRTEETHHEITYALGMIVNADRRGLQAQKDAEAVQKRMDELIARLEALETR